MNIKLDALVQVQLRGMWCYDYKVIALPAPSKTGKARVTVAKVDANGQRVMKGSTYAKAITVTADKIRPPKVVCPSCEEIWNVSDIDESTHQQWRCPCCGSWNDRCGSAS